MQRAESGGDIFFKSIKTIRHSRYSHYLIENEPILEIRSMEGVYHELVIINDLLDQLDWGFLYPVYKLYKQARRKYRKSKNCLTLRK